MVMIGVAGVFVGDSCEVGRRSVSAAREVS